MPIAASLAAVVFASALGGAASVTASFPPMAVDVTVAANVPATLVTRVLDEADTVWRATGLTFVWRRHSAAGASTVAAIGPSARRTLEVIIGNDHRAGPPVERENRIPLGWIVFVEPDVPASEIHLSYENAVAYMTDARGVVGTIEQMPMAEREMKLARAMGRALAHEIGHYLLASTAHTPRGLMRATHSASDLFGFQRDAFAIDAAQRQAVAERLRQEPLVASD